MVSPSDRKAEARILMHDWGCSQNKSCALAGISRTGFRYTPRSRKDEERLTHRIKEHALNSPQYGYRTIHELLNREGEKVNHKRVHRIWKQQGLQQPRRKPRKRRRGATQTVANKAQHKNHVWSYDFVHDTTEKGQSLRMLAVIDEYTRECLEIRVDHSINSGKVIDTLSWLFLTRGAPRFIRSDNGPEFVASALTSWLAAQGCTTLFIKPGSPWENAYIESFNSRLRAECLNRELFRNKNEAQQIVENWRREYNEFRPHSSLAGKTPAEFAEKCGGENFSLHRPTSGRRPVSLRLGGEAADRLLAKGDTRIPGMTNSTHSTLY